MSVAWVARVLDQSVARGGTRLVLISLAERANAEGKCWPSIADTAKRANLSTRAVKKSIQKLISMGELSITRKGGGRRLSNHYRLTLENGERQFTVLSEEKANSGSGNSEIPCSETVNHGSPEPKNEPSIHQQHLAPEKNGVVQFTVSKGQNSRHAADVCRALELAGIREPARSDLATLPNMSPELVERIAREVRASNGRGGVLIAALRDASMRAGECAAAFDGDVQIEANRISAEDAALAGLAEMRDNELEEVRCRFLETLHPRERKKMEFVELKELRDPPPNSPSARMAVELWRHYRTQRRTGVA